MPGTLLFHHWQDPHCDRNFSHNATFLHVEIENSWFLRHQLKPSVLEGSLQLKNPALKPIFRKIYREMKLNDQATQVSVDGLLLQALGDITRSSVRARADAPAWVKKVKEILYDADLERVTLKYLSSQTGVHPVHISREFHKYFRCSFGEYVRNIRIEKAVLLLSDPSFKLSQVAYACGFADESHFIKCFRNAVGITPNRYRKV